MAVEPGTGTSRSVRRVGPLGRALLLPAMATSVWLALVASVVAADPSPEPGGVVAVTIIGAFVVAMVSLPLWAADGDWAVPGVRGAAWVGVCFGVASVTYWVVSGVWREPGVDHLSENLGDELVAVAIGAVGVAIYVSASITAMVVLSVRHLR